MSDQWFVFGYKYITISRLIHACSHSKLKICFQLQHGRSPANCLVHVQIYAVYFTFTFSFLFLNLQLNFMSELFTRSTPTFLLSKSSPPGGNPALAMSKTDSEIFVRCLLLENLPAKGRFVVPMRTRSHVIDVAMGTHVHHCKQTFLAVNMSKEENSPYIK